ETDLPLPQRLGEGVRGAGRVGAGKDRRRLGALTVADIRGQLRQGRLEHLDVIGGGARAGVTGTQDRRQMLTGLVEEAVQRVEAEAALAVRCGALLLPVALLKLR